MTVMSAPVVEHFNVIEDICPGQTWVLYIRFLMRFFFSELKNDSATALSQQLPRRLILGARLLARQNLCLSSLPYWLPWLLCTTTLSVGLRRQTAINNASRASSRDSVGFIDQPY
ncbi:hypothetical protein L378_01709 [Klebsiella pneumoniae MGH 32]|uniref:Uncharacterized protein n=1 Tax=Klebsiella pneumoniae TaxID=573 RepID=A0A2L1KRU4_KLEPN|nr:hypothetical protein ICEKp7_0038 [Klebsiella pneumoniae]ESN04440.1 hypothetical protein L378_01709 [Klebsiella pneumoniae MGH 32]